MKARQIVAAFRRRAIEQLARVRARQQVVDPDFLAACEQDRIEQQQAWLYGILERANSGYSLQQTLEQLTSAYTRARETLELFLSEAEKQQLETFGYFEMPSKLYPGRIYRIPGGEATVRAVEHGQDVLTICVRPAEAVPWPDVMLAYKLGLEADEAHWLEKANKWDPSQLFGTAAFGSVVTCIPSNQAV